MDDKIQELENIITLQKNEIEQLKERLSKYTNPKRNKKYYETHKEELIEKAKEYNKTKRPVRDKEKVKEYNKKYYQKRKMLKKNNTDASKTT